MTDPGPAPCAGLDPVDDEGTRAQAPLIVWSGLLAWAGGAGSARQAVVLGGRTAASPCGAT